MIHLGRRDLESEDRMDSPNLRRTWSPRGERPIVRQRFRRDRLSVIGGLTVSPGAHRLRLRYDIHSKNIRQPEVRAFLRTLLRSRRGPVGALGPRLDPPRGDHP